jgi:ABC-type nitrate/sulfonate/bicarbonate transport system substrate-binding protein
MVSTWFRRAIVIGAVLGLIAAGCGGDDDDDAGGGDEEEAAVIRHASSSTADAYIPQYRAPELFGDEFGISTDEHLTMFENHATASQLLASGQAEVGSGSVTQAIQLIQQGIDVKLFCPVQTDSTEHIAGRTEAITSLDQITDPDVRVAIDSPGGLINFIMNMLFAEQDLGITVDDLENVSVLEDGSLRLGALAAGDVDVGSVDLFEIADLREQLGEDAVTVLSVVAEDVDFMANVAWAPTEWLEENPDLAAAYCATILYSNRQLASDFEQYQAALDRYVTGGVEEEIARGNWEFAREYEVWPYNTSILNEDIIQNQIEVSVDSGLVEESALDISFDELVDTEVMDQAMELLGGEVTAEQVESGDI